MQFDHGTRYSVLLNRLLLRTEGHAPDVADLFEDDRDAVDLARRGALRPRRDLADQDLRPPGCCRRRRRGRSRPARSSARVRCAAAPRSPRARPFALLGPFSSGGRSRSGRRRAAHHRRRRSSPARRRSGSRSRRCCCRHRAGRRRAGCVATSSTISEPESPPARKRLPRLLMTIWPVKRLVVAAAGAFVGITHGDRGVEAADRAAGESGRAAALLDAPARRTAPQSCWRSVPIPRISPVGLDLRRRRTAAIAASTLSDRVDRRPVAQIRNHVAAR